MKPPPSHAPAGALVAAACVLLLMTAGLLYCGAGCVSTPAGERFTVPAENGIVAGELDLCDIVLGALDPAAVSFACPGQSALFRAALDKVTALPDAGATFQSSAPLAFPILRTARGYPVWHRGVHLGYVPTAAAARAIASPQVQLFLDGLGKDGGR